MGVVMMFNKYVKIFDKKMIKGSFRSELLFFPGGPAIANVSTGLAREREGYQSRQRSRPAPPSLEQRSVSPSAPSAASPMQ